MSNNFGKQSDKDLQALVASASAILSVKYADYGIDKTLADQFALAVESYSGAMADAKRKHDAAIEATTAKDASRVSVMWPLRQLSAILYGPASIATDGQLASLGFAPRRSKAVRPMVAQAVTGVTAIPSVDGTVALSWDRGDNTATATAFQIFASHDGGATWEFVASTPRVKATVAGYAPGLTVWFRVVAATATTVSLPSVAAVIYGPQPTARFELKVA